MNDNNISYWIDTTQDTNFSVLDNDITVDVAIIGGGLSGLMAAYFLKKEGINVAILEAMKLAKATTGNTTAKITSQHNLIYDKIKKSMSIEMAKQYADANESAIKTISDIITMDKIDCDFEKKDAYVYTQEKKYVKKIEKEVDTALSVGIDAEYLEQTPLPFSVLAAMRFTNQAQFHPIKFALSIINSLANSGALIFEGTRAVDIKEGNTCQVITDRGKRVTAKHIIITSHYPFYDGKGMYFTRMHAVKSYVIGVTIQESFPDGMFITAENVPGRSLRYHPIPEGQLVLIGGEHHKTGQGGSTMVHYDNLRTFAKDTFTVKKELYRWSAQDYTTLDNIPYVGRLTSDTPNIYVATGFKKWGMTNSVASAMIIKDLILKGESKWQDVYNPQRGNIVASAATFAVQNADVAYQLISGKLERPDDIGIEKGEGKVVEYKGKRTGVYKDAQGNLHLLDTTCTHMGCELQWNDAEKTWDCPCHGSRFSYTGDIIEGPALYPLKHPDEGRNIVEPNVFKDKEK